MNPIVENVSDLNNEELCSFFKKGKMLRFVNYFLTVVLMLFASLAFFLSKDTVPNALKGTAVDTAFHVAAGLSAAVLILLSAYLILLTCFVKKHKCWIIRKSVTALSFILSIAVFTIFAIGNNTILYGKATEGIVSNSPVIAKCILFLPLIIVTLIFALKTYLAVRFRKYDLLLSQAEIESDKRVIAYLETEDISVVKKIKKAAYRKNAQTIIGNILFGVFPAWCVLYKFVGGEGFIFKAFSWLMLACAAYVICYILEKPFEFFQSEKKFKLPIRFSAVNKFLKETQN